MLLGTFNPSDTLSFCYVLYCVIPSSYGPPPEEMNW